MTAPLEGEGWPLPDHFIKLGLMQVALVTDRLFNHVGASITPLLSGRSAGKPLPSHTDPELAWVGLTETEAMAQGVKVKKGLFPRVASGRAIANGRDEGFTKLLFDDSPEAHGHGSGTWQLHRLAAGAQVVHQKQSSNPRGLGLSAG